MSAIRYSGSVRIRITYVDQPGVSYVNGKLDPANWYADGTPRYPNGSYRASVTAGGFTWRGIISAPAFLSEAVDSPEAFDDAAHAAISFAEEEMGSIVDHVDCKPDLSGWAISRKNPNAKGRV